MRAAISVFLVYLLATFGSVGAEENAPDSQPLLAAEGLLASPALMTRAALLSEIGEARRAWEKKYDALKTPEEIRTYQAEKKAYFQKMLGETWPVEPPKARITGGLVKPEYRVEKIVLETLAGFYATGTMFLPPEEKFAPPYPAVLVLCGHSTNGKASELYQGICILGAMNGLAMYIQDPIDQGERFQHLRDGKPYLTGVPAHNVVGAGSILLGRNTATFEVWDMARALDYLQSRSDVIADKLGVAGNSGGGTQTAYIMALDERVAAAAPSCYLCSFFGNLTEKLQPQDAEQNIFGQVAFGMDHADYPIMRAPKPTLLCTKTKDFFNIDDAWRSYRYDKRIFSRLRSAENLSIIEVDGEHGYCPEILEATVRFMARHLAGRDERIVCPDQLPLLTEQEICSLPDGILALPEARTTYDLNRDLCRTLAERRKEKFAGRSAEELAATVRRVAGITPFDDVPEPEKIDAKTGSNDFILRPQKGIYLPVRVERADTVADEIMLIVTENGRRSESAEKLFAQYADRPVYGVELRGWGETLGVGSQYYNHKWFGVDGVDNCYAYLLGKSYVGMRTNDLLATAKYLQKTTGKKIALAADGASSGIVALHAAAAVPNLFVSVAVPDGIPTWSEQIERSPTPIRLTDTIHGVLNEYDLDDLAIQAQ